jgi:hypothetical protein
MCPCSTVLPAVSDLRKVESNPGKHESLSDPGDIPRSLPRSDIHLWLGNVTLMVMRGLEDGDGDVKRYRSILRRFIAPAFASANPHVGA